MNFFWTRPGLQDNCLGRNLKQKPVLRAKAEQWPLCSRWHPPLPWLNGWEASRQQDLFSEHQNPSGNVAKSIPLHTQSSACPQCRAPAGPMASHRARGTFRYAASLLREPRRQSSLCCTPLFSPCAILWGCFKTLLVLPGPHEKWAQLSFPTLGPSHLSGASAAYALSSAAHRRWSNE